MESNLRSRVAEFEASYFLPFGFFFFFFFFFCKPALSPFSVWFLKSGGWCLASFVQYCWSVRFVILFPGVVSGGRKGLYYSVSCCGVMSWFLSWWCVLGGPTDATVCQLSCVFISFFSCSLWLGWFVSCCSLNQVLLEESVGIIVVVCMVVLESLW